MILDKINQKSLRFGIKIRFVDEKDAEKILQLRTNEKLTQHIHKTNSNLGEQVDYIRNYKKREEKGTEYYLTFLSLDNRVLGFYRLYKIDKENKSFTIGSWIFDSSVNDLTPIFADILSKDFGFNELGLETCYFNVRSNNKKVMKYHKLFSPIFINVDNEENNSFYLSKLNYETNVTEILKFLR